MIKTKRLLSLFIFLLSISLFIMLSLKVIIWNSTKKIRDFPEIKESGVMNIAMEYNSINRYKVSDSVADFQYGLCKYIDKRSGMKIQIHLENDLETAIRKLKNNVYDVIARDIPITNGNRQFLAFTVPTAQSKHVLVQRKHNNTDSVLFISNQLDLANQTIYVTKNAPVIMRLTHLAEEIAEPIHTKEISGYTPEQLIYMVATKEIDYFATDMETAIKNTELSPDLDFNTDISFTQLQAWALRKTSPVLLDSLNVWITAFLK